LYLDNVNFEKGVDFHRAIFIPVKNIYIDYWTKFPPGKFFYTGNSLKVKKNFVLNCMILL